MPVLSIVFGILVLNSWHLLSCFLDLIDDMIDEIHEDSALSPEYLRAALTEGFFLLANLSGAWVAGYGLFLYR